MSFRLPSQSGKASDQLSRTCRPPDLSCWQRTAQGPMFRRLGCLHVLGLLLAQRRPMSWKYVVVALSLACSCAAPEGEWDIIDDAKADDASAQSFGALAELTVRPAFIELSDALVAEFSVDTLPHEAKLLSKEIGRVRSFVDLFSYAYPGSDAFDPWSELRDELDDGYELMGAFKDLYDAQRVDDPIDAVYDADEVAALRAEVLEWRDSLVEPDRLAFYRHYLASASNSELHERDANELPRFYWREADVEPKKGLTGLENIARLERALLEEAEADLDDTADIGNLLKHDNEVVFHDFRKRLRSALKLIGDFPSIVDPDDDPSDELVVLDETVDRYGDLNDTLLAYHRAVDKGDDDEVDELTAEIKRRWDELQDWQKDEDIDDALEDLRRAIRK